MKKSKERSKKTPLFFCTKKPLPRMIADMGAGARLHILSQRKNDMGGDKKSAATNDSGYGCRGTLSYFITA